MRAHVSVKSGQIMLREIVRRDTRPELAGPNEARVLRDVFGFGQDNMVSEAAHGSVCYHWHNVIEQHNAVFTFNTDSKMP